MTERDRFYAERDLRTHGYGVAGIFDTPVGVFVGEDAANSPSGQLAVFALVNMLARIHRHLTLKIPRATLLRPCLVDADRLDDAARLLARTIDPFINLDQSECGHAIALGTGAAVAPWYAGVEGQVALIHRQPLRFDTAEPASLGAALIPCLAAANLLGQVLGRTQRVVRISAWDFREGSDAVRGPSYLGRLDVGSILQLGAGGVGSCFAYWLWEFGVLGNWQIVDGDFVKLHNCNRCLGLLPRHAGWFGGEAFNKAMAAAELFGAQPAPVWFDELDQDSLRPDLILPLANERSVRQCVACRGEPLIIHATTSPAWEAQLHRHIPERDDCISCRMPKQESRPQFTCATGRLQGGDHLPATDAALPFLSAAAGLMLLSGLYQLQHGDLVRDRYNGWAICLRDARRHTRRGVHGCHSGCATTLPAVARQKIHAGQRWSHVDCLTT